MDKTPMAFQTAIHKWAEEQRQGLVDALPDPELVAGYCVGNLAPDAEAALQNHLALHPAAARELLDLAEFARLQPPGEQHSLSEGDVEEALVAIRARIRLENERQNAGTSASEEIAANALGAEILPFPAKRIRMLWSIAWASAAAALIAIIVSASWLGALYRRLDDDVGPRYAKVIDVDTTRGMRPHAISPHAERILLVFHDVDVGSFARGQLEISGEGSDVFRRYEFTVALDQSSLLTLELPRDLFPDGVYRLEIFGLDSEGRHLLKEYLLRLEATETQ